MPSTNYRQQKVGRNFETAIANADITRAELAEMLGVHQTSFTYWYKRGVTADYAKQVADLLDLDVNEIMSTHKRKPKKLFVDELRESKVKLPRPEPRTVNMELLAIVAKMRLSAQQEATLHSLALTFLGEES
jgi:hypothetical protein